ncbi:LruC domain-containing protein [Bacteroides congonensis]
MQLYLLYIQIIPTFATIKSNPIINKTSTAVMKKKTVLFTSCLLGTLAFSSCEKNLYDESKQPEKEIHVKDLEIPEDFQWKLSQTAEGTVSATTPTMVSLFLNEACNEEEKVATIPVDAETSNLPLSIPTYIKTLYAQYKNSNNGTTKVPVTVNADGSFSLNIADSKVNRSRVITRGHDIEDDTELAGGVIYHPKNGWGTIMFEDQFPLLGDYDFNDFVINYKVQFQGLEKDKKKYTAKYIQIGLRLKAVGGIFPYSPYLRLKEIDSNDVESIEVYESSNINPAPDEIKIIPNKHLILDCSLLTENLHKPAGSKYFNTEKNALADTDDLPEIHILIELKDNKDVKDIIEDDEFDLYLKRNDSGTEIHMNGIEPVAYKYPFNDKNLFPVYESDGDEEDDNYYYSRERLIWGLRVPGNPAHAIEGADFLKAYKGFAKWAQSGGKNEQNWYNQGNADESLLIHN